MVQFNKDHKHELVATSSNSSLGTVIDWYDDDGNWTEVDIKKIETPELWALRHSMQRYMNEQLAIIDSELDNWTTVQCHICERDDLAYRGQPFITWGLRGGYILCPKHLMAYDRIGTPEGELAKQMREEEKEIEEIFG